MAYADNVTKFNAGGSGDNIVPDGYIKTVEKVWIDSYTMAQTTSETTIDIAIIPSNKKIVSIDVVIETSASQTSGGLALGDAGDIDRFFGAAATTTKNISHNLTVTTISFPGQACYMAANTVAAITLIPSNLAGFQYVTNGTTGTIQLTLHNWTASTGTVKTKVRYT